MEIEIVGPGKNIARIGETLFPNFFGSVPGTVSAAPFPRRGDPYALTFRGWLRGRTTRRVFLAYWRFIYDESTRFFGPPRYPDGKVWPRP